MHFFSSPSAQKLSFTTVFSPSQNPISPSKFSLNLHFKTLFISIPPSLSSQSSSSVLESPDNEDSKNETVTKLDALVIRRPLMEVSGEESVGEDDDKEETKDALQGLTDFAKKMPIFEPERVESGPPREKPLVINLDVALYRARILARNHMYQEAENILQKCIYFWPENGRPYVRLGKILSKQSRTAEARAVYDKGCQATQGENSYIWQCWAVLECKMGNVRRARDLFDAATVADKKHVAAWHGWAVLELKQGNVKKARQLLAKGLKYCRGNEYIYQTLALLEAKASRYEQARHLFKRATKYNPKSCASWLAWAQLEAQLENNRVAGQLFEKAIQASPKNRFAWHVWGVFEANIGNVEMGRKLLKIGHALNPKDPVLLQSLALLEYKYSTANVARVLFRRASELDPKHQPIWTAWGWVEWKEGNLGKARELYQKALSIDSTSESAARSLQAWGVLEQRVGNLSAARRLFRSSLSINTQSYITWMTWASLEEDQGNPVRAKEIRNLYFQQRTEVVDDPSWVTGLLEDIDPALDRIKRLVNLDQNPYKKTPELLQTISEANGNRIEEHSRPSVEGDRSKLEPGNGFNLDDFIREKLSLDPFELDIPIGSSRKFASTKVKSLKGVQISEGTSTILPQASM